MPSLGTKTLPVPAKGDSRFPPSVLPFVGGPLAIPALAHVSTSLAGSPIPECRHGSVDSAIVKIDLELGDQAQQGPRKASSLVGVHRELRRLAVLDERERIAQRHLWREFVQGVWRGRLGTRTPRRDVYSRAA